MPTLKKLLSKFNKKDKIILEALVEKLLSLSRGGLDVKKLQGHDNIFRLRKGRLRVIFYKRKVGISIINMECRNDKTYRF